MIDYTGCDETIAKFLVNGQSILCECCDDKNTLHRSKCYVIAFNNSDKHPYITKSYNFRYAKPIIKSRKAKSFTEIAKYLDDNYYICNGKGNWEPTRNTPEDHLKPVYPSYLFTYCGREIPDGVFFPEEWLV